MPLHHLGPVMVHFSVWTHFAHLWTQSDSCAMLYCLLYDASFIGIHPWIIIIVHLLLWLCCTNALNAQLFNSPTFFCSHYKLKLRCVTFNWPLGTNEVLGIWFKYLCNIKLITKDLIEHAGLKEQRIKSKQVQKLLLNPESLTNMCTNGKKSKRETFWIWNENKLSFNYYVQSIRNQKNWS